ADRHSIRQCVCRTDLHCALASRLVAERSLPQRRRAPAWHSGGDLLWVWVLYAYGRPYAARRDRGVVFCPTAIYQADGGGFDQRITHRAVAALAACTPSADHYGGSGLLYRLSGGLSYHGGKSTMAAENC